MISGRFSSLSSFTGSAGARVRFGQALCLLLVFARPGSPQPPGNSVEAQLREAESCYEHQRYEQAQRILERVLREFPRNFAGNELMAAALSARGQDAAARPYFKAAADANPSSAAALGNFAANLAKLHEDRLAEASFAKALTLEPHSYELNHNFGEFQIGLGRLKQAIPLLKAAQEARPEAYANGYDLALAELKSGMPREAERQIRSLLKLRDTAELHSLLGEAAEKQSRFVEAAGELQRAALMDPSEDNLFDWGAELLRHETLAPSLQVFRRGAELYPRSWKMQAGLGVALYLSGHNDDAAEALCRAIDIDPGNRRTYFFLFRVRNLTPDASEKVLLRFQRYAGDQPRNAEALFYDAAALLALRGGRAGQGDQAKAESLLHRAIALDPAFAEAHLQLGILLAETGRDEEARREYQESIAADPSLGVAHYRLGQAFMRAGDAERARKELAAWSGLRDKERETAKEREQIMQFTLTPSGAK